MHTSLHKHKQGSGSGDVLAGCTAGLLPYMGKPLSTPLRRAGISQRDVTTHNSPRILDQEVSLFLRVGISILSPSLVFPRKRGKQSDRALFFLHFIIPIHVYRVVIYMYKKEPGVRVSTD